VARFGNIHLIYSSLRRRDFETLISMEVDKIVTKSWERFGISLTVSDNVKTLIYRNGVFPVQGVRPVFSSVIDILETNLSKYLFEAVMRDAGNISIDYSFERQCLITNIGEETLETPYTGRIDKIRQSNLDAVIANVSVHESGHAVAYVTLFGLAPLQLKSKVASSYAGGFTFPHQIYETKDSILKKAMVFLAGGIAEEIVFGADHATTGRSNDRENATSLLMDFIRVYGFDERFQASYMLENQYAMNKDKTDDVVEEMMAKLVADTRQLLEKHHSFLLDLSLKLKAAGSLEARDVAEVAAQFGLHAAIQPEGYMYLHDYKVEK